MTLIAFLMLIATNHPFLSRDALPSLRMQGFEKNEREGVESIRVGFFVVFVVTDRSSGDKILSGVFINEWEVVLCNGFFIKSKPRRTSAW